MQTTTVGAICCVQFLQSCMFGISARSLIVISYEPHTSIGLEKMSCRYVKIKINQQKLHDIE